MLKELSILYSSTAMLTNNKTNFAVILDYAIIKKNNIRLCNSQSGDTCPGNIFDQYYRIHQIFKIRH